MEIKQERTPEEKLHEEKLTKELSMTALKHKPGIEKETPEDIEKENH